MALSPSIKLYMFKNIDGIFLIPNQVKIFSNKNKIANFEWNEKIDNYIQNYNIALVNKKILKIEYYLFENSGYMKLKYISFIDEDNDTIIEEFTTDIYVDSFRKKYQIKNDLQFTEVILDLMQENTSKNMWNIINMYDLAYLTYEYTIETYYGL